MIERGRLIDFIHGMSSRELQIQFLVRLDSYRSSVDNVAQIPERDYRIIIMILMKPKERE